MIFESIPEFEKDLKHLQKKYKSLPEDLEVVQLILTHRPDEHVPFSFRIPDLKTENCIIKVKKIACKSLKGKGVNSGLRLIYTCFPKHSKIVLIELYHKSEREKEDRERIKLFCNEVTTTTL